MAPGLRVLVVLVLAADADTLDLRRLTHTYQGTWPAVRVGTALQHIAHVAEDLGLASHGLYDGSDEAFHQWSVAEIEASVAAGRLVIPLVRFGLLPGHETTGVRDEAMAPVWPARQALARGA